MGFLFLVILSVLHLVTLNVICHFEAHSDNYDQRSANANILTYLNLSVLPVARDNLRQSMLDVLGLRAGLTLSAQGGALAQSPLKGFNPASGKVKLLGHSLGGIIGASAVASANQTLGSPQADALYSFSAASLQNSGGQIANLVLGSDSYGPLAKHNLALVASSDYQTYASVSCTSLSSQQCFNQFEGIASPAQLAQLNAGFAQFAYAAQTVMDTIDPFTNASSLVSNGSPTIPFLMTQSQNDNTVPNTVAGAPFAGTTPLANKLGLKAVTAADSSVNATASFVKFNSSARHATFIAPQINLSDRDHFVEMQTINADFLADDSLSGVTDTSVLQ